MFESFLDVWSEGSVKLAYGFSKWTEIVILLFFNTRIF